MKQQYFETLRNGQAIRGMLALPDGASAAHPAPVALLLHGFTGTSCDYQFAYHKLARLLAEAGIASLRFDFLGSGNSDGEFRHMSVLTETEDALAVLSAVKELPFIDSSRIAVNGLSMGGLVACLAASRVPEDVHCLSLWSPALCVTLHCQEGHCQDVSLDCLATEEFLDFHGLELGRSFVQDALSVDVYREIHAFRGPIQVIHGTGDDCVPISFSEKLLAEHPEQCSLVKIDGAGHLYNTLSHVKQLLEQTVSFLKSQLL